MTIAFRPFVLLCGLLPLTGQAQHSSAHKADSLFRAWCDTTLQRYPRTIALARFFGMDSSITEEQASRLQRSGTLPGLTERQRQYQLAYAWHARGTDLGWRARTDEALAAFAEATRIFEELGDRNGVIGTECYKADLYLARGMLAEAVITMQPAAQAYMLMGDSLSAVDALWTIANALGSQGNIAAADREYRRALSLIDPGQRFRRFSWLSELAGFHAHAGNADTAMVLVQQARELSEGLPLESLLPLVVTEARTHLLRQDCRAAQQLLQDPARTIQLDKQWLNNTRSELYTVLAEATLCLRDPADARTHASTALRLAEEADHAPSIVAALRVLAEAHEELGDARNALACTKRFLTIQEGITNATSATAANNAVLAAEFQRQQIADSVQVAAKRARDAAEAEASNARERTRRNVFLFVGVGLALFAAVVISQRNRIRKEHGRSEELLLNILPHEVAQELKQKGEADARSIEEVTILFTDFKGFTSISEQLTARQLVDELNACFKAFDHIITNRGIEKIKTIGDAYMCAGGLHGQDRTTPVQVVLAALEMQDFMRERKTARQAAGLPAFEMRVGIHTGPVVAGIVGVKKFQYDIWGDTVNTASRMESAGAVGQVNISDSTALLLRGSPGLRCIPRGPMEVKGKGTMEMWFVERA